MNALVFNTTAEQLKTSIYGYNPTTTTFEPIKLSSDGELLVSIAGAVTIGNSITIANGSLTVNIPDSVTVTGTINIGNSITIGNESLTVSISNTDDINVNINGNSFTSATLDAAPLTETEGNIFEQNISTYRTATFFVENSGTQSITVSLQLSPNGTDYFDSPNHTISLTAGAYTIMPVEIFAYTVHLSYAVASTTDASLTAYFNAQA